MEQDHTVGALNSVQVGADGVTIDPKFRMGILGPLDLDAERLGDRDFPEIIEAKTLFGAALMIRARAIQQPNNANLALTRW